MYSQCVCECEVLLPGNKNRGTGVAGPPEGKPSVMKEGRRKGQNEKEKEEEQGDLRQSFQASRSPLQL